MGLSQREIINSEYRKVLEIFRKIFVICRGHPTHMSQFIIPTKKYYNMI